ncbi:MAG TPA: NAD(+)/NADH kinase [Thermomicrobiales bacterium]|nr:NAD(+)/NADH kinase [Thermomicrobiales bacterium]
MIQKIGIIAAQSKEEANALAPEIETWLRERDIDPVVERELDANGHDDVDAIVVLGGDGLMMRAANAYPDTPLLGINFGQVGFLTLVEQQHWREALEALTSGTVDVEVSSTLQATLYRDEEEIDMGWAINDVVIRSGHRMVEVELYIDGDFVNPYPGDGMIVSTARGSTAYCMAAGGPILTAGVKGFALVPISCHSPIRTPMVASEEALIELLIGNDHAASLILDGRPGTDLRMGDVIKVERGKHTFQLAKIGTLSFYESVRTKFNFRIRPNTTPSRPHKGQRPGTVGGVSREDGSG